MTEQESYISVWDAICDSPGEATVMKLKSKLLMVLQARVKSFSGEEEAVTFLGITKLRLSDLIEGKIDRFTFEQLIQLAVTAGVELDLQVKGPI